MGFESDPEKSRLNKEKHGIDFVEAKELLKDENAFRFPAKEGNEERFLIVGKIDEKNWTAVVTMRDEVFRIISVRRSKRKEIEAYDWK